MGSAHFLLQEKKCSKLFCRLLSCRLFVVLGLCSPWALVKKHPAFSGLWWVIMLWGIASLWGLGELSAFFREIVEDWFTLPFEPFQLLEGFIAQGSSILEEWDLYVYNIPKIIRPLDSWTIFLEKVQAVKHLMISTCKIYFKESVWGKRNCIADSSLVFMHPKVFRSYPRANSQE